MVGITLDDYRANVKEVARPNRFLMSIPTAPKGINPFDFDDAMQYHIRATSIPGRTVGDITVLFWQGMNDKRAGDPTYDDLTFTFLNNVNFNIKELFESWMNGIANSATNARLAADDYKAIIRIDQLGKQSNVIGSYFLHGAFPKSLEPIELSQETIDSQEEFNVLMSLDYWSGSGTPGAEPGTVLKGTVA